MKNLLRGLLFSAVLLTGRTAAAQTLWHDPAEDKRPVVQGQGWSGETAGTYNRLPERARERVRPTLWQLSTHSAGLALHFCTNSPTIRVRCRTSGMKAMDHMPATGVSGLDLYSVDNDGALRFLRRESEWRQGDTVLYTFHPVAGDTYAELGYEFRLYLPLYAHVEQVEVGTAPEARFEWMTQRDERPIVAYGTSILQGGCASRPAMAWTNILSRRLDRTVINLGFSGNGRMDPEILELLGEIDARAYLIDCLPNLEAIDDSTVTARYLDGIRQLRRHSDAPIVLVEHSAGTPDYANDPARHKNGLLRECYRKLLDEGIGDVHYLGCEQLALPADGTVDGIHPTDLGMEAVATAYERMLRSILREPAGAVSTTRAVTQRREIRGYDWQLRHRDILRQNRQSPPRVAMIGNSITHYWGGSDGLYPENGRKTWNKIMEPAGFRNMGCGSDRIENMLWRIYHGELDGYRAERVVLLAGANNLGCNSDEEIVEGILRLAEAAAERQPHSRVEVIGILPCRHAEARIARINRTLDKALAEQGIAAFHDVGAALLRKDGSQIDERLFLDGLHPNEKGYDRIAAAITAGKGGK